MMRRASALVTGVAAFVASVHIIPSVYASTPESTPALLETAGSECRLPGGKVVEDGFSGKDGGRNYCNTCTCSNGAGTCTEMFCVERTDCPVAMCAAPNTGCHYATGSEREFYADGCPKNCQEVCSGAFGHQSVAFAISFLLASWLLL